MKYLTVLLIVLTLFLGGCTWWQTTPDLIVAANPTQGHPSAVDGGLLVTFRCSGGTGEYTLDPGDGTGLLPAISTESFDYPYSIAGTYAAVITSGGQSKTITIEVTNHAPVVYVPFTVNPTYCDWMGKKLYDVRYQEHGCDAGTGAPLWAYGAYDPDGDSLTYKWTVTGPDKDGEIVEYSVFDTHPLPDDEVRKSISGKFTDDPLTVFFAGWTAEEPPYEFFVNPLGCEIDPWVIPEPDPGAGTVTLTLTVRDMWGGETTIGWTISLASTGCS